MSQQPYPLQPQKQGMSGWTIALIIGAVGCLPALAIAGILAAIAIPNYLKFNCKARQSEAKTNLSGLFTAEKVFFGEYNGYSTDLVAVHWFPDGAPIYVYGFTTADDTGPDLAEVIPDYDTGRNHTYHPEVHMDSQTGTERYSTAKMLDSNGTSQLRLEAALACGEITGQPTAGPCGLTPSAPEFGFVAGASGDIDMDASAGPPTWDHWNVNGQRVLTNTYDDCSN